MSVVEQPVAQGLRSHRQQRATEQHTVALEPFGHASQARQTSAPAECQQHSFRLVIGMLPQQHGIGALLSGRRRKGMVAGAPRRVFRTLARRMAGIHPAYPDRHTQTSTQVECKVLESVGRSLQTVMDVDRHHPARPALMRGEQKSGGISPRAIGNGDLLRILEVPPAPPGQRRPARIGRRGHSADQRLALSALVSVKRP